MDLKTTNKEQVRAHIALFSGVAGTLLLVIGVLGAVAFWPKWGGTFAGIACVGLAGLMTWFVAMTVTGRRTFWAVFILVLPLPFWIALNFCFASGFDGGFRDDILFALFLIVIFGGTCVTLASCFLHEIAHFDKTLAEHLVAGKPTSEELAARKAGWPIGDFVAVLGAVGFSVGWALILMGDVVPIPVALSMMSNTAILMAFGLASGTFDLWAFRSRFVLALACTAPLLLIGGLVDLNYLPSLSEYQVGYMMLRLSVGGVITMVGLIYGLSILSSWLNPKSEATGNEISNPSGIVDDADPQDAEISNRAATAEDVSPGANA